MRLFKVVDEGSGRAEGQGEVLHPEPLQGVYPKLAAELFRRGIIYERPFFQGGDIVVAIALAGSLEAVALDHQFLGRE